VRLQPIVAGRAGLREHTTPATSADEVELLIGDPAKAKASSAGLDHEIQDCVKNHGRADVRRGRRPEGASNLNLIFRADQTEGIGLRVRVA